MDLLERIDDWGPEKVVCVADNRTGMRGVLVIDNTARGMGKGGTRMSPSLGVSEVSRLARVMTWKWAAADLYYGGAKAGIRHDPASPDKEAIVRSFVRALANEVPKEYVIGLDIGLTEHDAAIVVDELGFEAAVGTPADLGGLPYDDLGVTGFGVAEAASAACAEDGRELAGLRVAIQGFGAVGRAAAKRFDELGCQVVAISTRSGAIRDQNGLDVDTLLALSRQYGDDLVNHMPEARRVAPEEVLLGAADMLVPAATQDVIDESIARSLQATVVVEGANMPCTDGALEVLSERGTLVVPDVIANAGGAISAAFAMEARTSPFTPDLDLVFSTIASKVAANTRSTLEMAKRNGIRPHVAARSLAQQRVSEAMAIRGHRAPEMVVVK